MSEFQLIDRFFAASQIEREDVVLGVGDDAAVVRVPPGMELALSIDTLVAGVHFAADADAEGIGHKALAVNLSDMAAMGAAPAWATLSLTLPRIEEDWVRGFCAGFFGLAARHRVQLVGGDITRGPLSITVQLHGFVPPGAALRRSGARPGDLIYVTGTLGDAGLALALAGRDCGCRAADRDYLAGRLCRPEPRVAAGLHLRGLATAAIDVSDGLGADLGHILTASGVGARLELDRLPVSEPLRACLDALWSHPDCRRLPPFAGVASPEQAHAELALGSGDDYELCFTVAPERREKLMAAFRESGCACTCIGTIEPVRGLRCMLAACEYRPRRLGYDHFGRPEHR